MKVFQHGGFQTVEFALLLVWAVWLVLGREISWRFLGVLSLLGLLGLLGLQARSDLFPVLPFYVSFWRLLATASGAALVGEYLSEWRNSPGGHFLSHAGGLGLALGGTLLAWWANWEVSSATLLLASFLGLGYCARENRL